MELQSVVDTMKALAVVNIGIYEKVDQSLSEYYRTIELGLIGILRQYRPVLLSPGYRQAAGGVGIVIFGSDQGMVGQFNDSLASLIMDKWGPTNGNISVWAVGERITLKIQDKLAIEKQYRVPDSANGIVSLIGSIVLDIDRKRQTGAIHQLSIFYNKPLAGTGYQPTVQQLLPIDLQWLAGLEEQPWPTNKLPQVVQEHNEAFQLFIREYLFISLCRVCTGSLVSENIGRLASMQRATKNIDDLLAQLRGIYNEERQSSITEELFDLVFGFDALARDTDR
ncbi:ATP synthase gamma chain, sodium ion specific [Methylomusa anaerophila]|uniref:ATP synthase gamma chain, sodium ion specific n=2 Tax=Methylomusa anaerophila TaxID=1930071 RepID=A0A348ALC1_9FIRM|nr:ATP synthase gamma chain, sodium ion specific [Methylomusa anaerophila]